MTCPAEPTTANPSARHPGVGQTAGHRGALPRVHPCQRCGAVPSPRLDPDRGPPPATGHHQPAQNLAGPDSQQRAYGLVCPAPLMAEDPRTHALYAGERAW